MGTTYAISFVLLQVFGFVLATKQPSMTGATLADIIRRNRGDSRRDKITDFAASISRSQFAAALGNIFAVCIGAVVFDQIWRAAFHSPYVPTDQAEHVYKSLHPLASFTAIDAALTGIILWFAGLIGGWCENFAVYHRIPAAVSAVLTDHLTTSSMGKMRQVVLPCAYSLPAASVKRASAVAIRDPTWITWPSQLTTPVVIRSGRT